MIFDVWTIAGIGGGLFLGIVAWVIYKIVKERKDEDYEEIDRVEMEKERIAKLTFEQKKETPTFHPKSNNDLLMEMEDSRTEEVENIELPKSEAVSDDWDKSISDDDDYDIKSEEEVKSEV